MSYKTTINWIGYTIVIILAGDFMTHLIAAEAIMRGKSKLDITSSISIWPKVAVDSEDSIPGVYISAFAGYQYTNGQMKYGASTVYPLLENGQVELYKDFVVFYDELARLHYVVRMGPSCSVYSGVDEQGMDKFFPRLQPHDAAMVIHTPTRNLDSLYVWGLYPE